MSKSKNALAGLPAESFDPTGNWFRTLRISSLQKDSTIFTVLLSKLLYTEETLSEVEIVGLFVARENMIEKCAEDKGYNDKWFWLLFLTRHSFSCLSAFAADLPGRLQVQIGLTDFFSHGRAHLGAHIYYGWKGKLVDVRMIVGEPVGPKAKNRIGVGYRDKGTAKNSAEDGSPSWQEVSMCEYFQLSQDQAASVSEKLDGLYTVLQTTHQCGYSWQQENAVTVPSKLTRRMRG